MIRAELQAAIDLLHGNDPDAVVRSVSLLRKSIYRLSMRFCGRHEDAEDTSQEVLLRVAALLPRFTSAEALALWLYKVAKSRCLNSRRRSKFAPERILSLEELLTGGREVERTSSLQATSPEITLLETEKVERVLTAIRALSPRYRIVLLLHDVEELSSGEISDILQLDERAVRVRLHRARRSLRDQLATAGKPPRREVIVPNAGIAEQDRGCEELMDALSTYPDRAAARSICREIQIHLLHCHPSRALVESLEKAAHESSQGASTRRRQHPKNKYRD
jgi:RNA polymerase sigma-70 factor (ECF subfamily)